MTLRWRHAAWLACTLLVLAGCGRAPLEWQGRTMGTSYTVRLPQAPEAVGADALRAEVDAELAAVNAAMSTYDPDSELSRFNASASTDWHAVSPALASVVARALEVSAASDGAFDVTVGPLVNLWGFGPEFTPARVPEAASIAEARARVGYRQLEVRASPPALRKHRPDLYVDLSALAKGYGVDRVAALLERRGAAAYLVEVGGEVRSRGRNPEGRPWAVAVERPEPGPRSVQRVLRVGTAAVATSGDYRNFFEIDGVRYSHAIDPVSGWPVRHGLVSASVVADDCASADAWATALMVLGEQRALAVAERQGLAAYLVSRAADGTLVEAQTSALQAALAREEE